VAEGARAYARNFDWADDVTLWSQAAATSPDSFKTHLGVAESRLYTQSLETALDGAIREQERAMSIVAGLPLERAPNNVYAELGELYRLKGEAVAPREADGTRVPSTESRIWYDKALQVLLRGEVIDRAVAAEMRKQELAKGKQPDRIAPFGLSRLYASLGQTYLRLDQPRKALDSFLFEKRLDAANPAVYRRIAAAQTASGNLKGAAIALIGAHLLSDSDLNQSEIQDLYQRMDRSNCAIRQGIIPTLNLDCALVRSDICASLVDIAGTLSERGLDAGVRQMTELARQPFGCPMEPFENATADKRR
jgi:hypothetical protein